jgi:hypothetical protein
MEKKGNSELLFIDQAVSEEKIFYESTNQQRELPVLAMFVNGSKMNNLYRGLSLDAIPYSEL